MHLSQLIRELQEVEKRHGDMLIVRTENPGAYVERLYSPDYVATHNDIIRVEPTDDALNGGKRYCESDGGGDCETALLL